MLKKNKFWKIYRFFVIFFFIIILGIWATLWVFLKSYEDGRPDYTAKEVVKLYNDKNYDKILKFVELDDNSNSESLKVALSNAYSDELTYIKKAGVYTKDNPVYSIIDSNDESATIYLKKKSIKGLFGINRWEVDKIVPNFEKVTINIIVPSNVNPLLNDNLLDESSLVSQDYYPDDLKIINEITPITSYYQYEVKDVYSGYKLEVSSGSLAKNENTYTYIYPENTEILNNVEDSLKEFCMNYARYVGNETNFSSISSQVLPGTDVYELLSGISNTNKWSGYHTPTQFSDILFNNMEMYSDNAFKVEANYKYSYTADIGDQEFEANLTLYLVKYNDTWLIANLNT